MAPKHLFTPRREEEESTKRRSYGARHGGVRTIDDILARCIVNEDTGCWEWQGARSQGLGGGVHVVPALWMPALGATMTGMKAAAILAGKVEPDAPKSTIVWRACRCRTCLNPEHLRVGTRKEWGADMAARGAMTGPWRQAANLKASASRRKVSPELLETILASEGTCEGVGALHGLSKSTISRIRRGDRYALKVVAGASVFSWRPAA